ncbi:putative amino acid transporter protein [Neofusicoccum parvum UCRNP2]|uniref:Putative amino acid transporter protein n=1 Tax=Botryosphaeria parva (strain UCR-NP2) TaxID=1287680 RepID=R1GVS4_BOTPV|nr:putative amino acid transporter protein [Neofusicoccum parvum UCRNP2]
MVRRTPPNSTPINQLTTRPRHTLTDAEKAAYISAELCLQAALPQLGIPGAQSRWDELQYVHVTQTPVIHMVGAFLPWHRLYVRAHEHLLQSECGYAGGQPYWNETRDVAALADSSLFDPDTGFGGDGVGGDGCVADGPFANLTLRFAKNGEFGAYCLERSLSSRGFEGAAQSNVEGCLESEGLTDIGGTNMPTDRYIEMNGFTEPGSAIYDYDGDPGNVTTLNHNLWMVGVIPNVTIAEVMDLGGSIVCAEYV